VLSHKSLSSKTGLRISPSRTDWGMVMRQMQARESDEAVDRTGRPCHVWVGTRVLRPCAIEPCPLLTSRLARWEAVGSDRARGMGCWYFIICRAQMGLKMAERRLNLRWCGWETRRGTLLGLCWARPRVARAVPMRAESGGVQPLDPAENSHTWAAAVSQGAGLPHASVTDRPPLSPGFEAKSRCRTCYKDGRSIQRHSRGRRLPSAATVIDVR
jgi:hypothetical protein